MPIPITDKFKPKGVGGYPLMDAEDVLMPDGKRLSEFESGKPGKDGVTPHIGANGNWWIGETDTGVKAQGEPGPQGPSGLAVQTSGYVVFDITEDGILRCTYSGDEPPNYSINNNGHLILEI